MVRIKQCKLSELWKMHGDEFKRKKIKYPIK